jgi:hypothetical protein
MALISRQLPALYNGVSQQPATLRLPSQAESLVNGYATVTDGLMKRPPFQHVAQMSSDDLSSAFMHSINRDTNERYIVVVTDGDVRVFDALTGDEKTVNKPLGTTYLNLPVGATAKESFAVVSIADYSFIVNKTVKVATKAAPTGEPADANLWYFPAGWDEELSNYYTVAQGANRGSVQTFSDLPDADDDTPPVQGDVYKIEGSGDDSFGAYYVIRNSGVWQETHAPNEATALDEATMPMALVRESDGTFTLTDFPWKPRFIGDNKSNPPPTFVGRTINDVFYYKNRLGFVSDENVVFSGASDFGNFWRTTVTDLIDSDVVDAAVSNTKVSLLEFAVPFNNGLMLFSDQTQFSLNVDQILTPSSVSIDAVTNYEMNSGVRPVGIGSDVYFVTESGNYSRVREYFVREDENTTDATDVTAHVPRYVPNGVFKLTGNGNEDVLFALSSQFPNRVYVYKFFWNGSDKVQSAWWYWELADDCELLSITVLENQLFAVVKRADGTYLEKCDIQPGAVTGALSFDVLLDRRCSPTMTDNGTDTFYTLPYPVAADQRADYKLVETTGDTPGRLLDMSQAVWVNATTIRFSNQLHDETSVVGGLNYVFEYEFSEQFAMNGEQAITTGRLQLRTFIIYFTDTAFFKTSVAPYGTDPLVEDVVPASLSEFSGKTLGEASLVLDSPNFHTGQYAFQVYGNSRTAIVKLVNDVPFQSKFQSAEWEALYHNRARPS